MRTGQGLFVGSGSRGLALTDVFEALPAQEIAEISWGGSSVRLGAGALLYEPDDLNETLYVLRDGRVRVFRRTTEGREFTLSVVQGGTVFGELALTDTPVRGAYAQCMEDSEITILRGADVEDLILRRPDVGLRLVRVLAGRLNTYERRLEDLGLKEVPARLTSLILHLIESEGLRTRSGYKIPTRYTHHHLAAMIGANREAVTRAFTQLRDAAILETKDRLILVRDIEALERAAEEGLSVKS